MYHALTLLLCVWLCTEGQKRCSGWSTPHSVNTQVRACACDYHRSPYYCKTQDLVSYPLVTNQPIRYPSCWNIQNCIQRKIKFAVQGTHTCVHIAMASCNDLVFDCPPSSSSILGASSIIYSAIRRKRVCNSKVHPLFVLSIADLLLSLLWGVGGLLWLVRSEDLKRGWCMFVSLTTIVSTQSACACVCLVSLAMRAQRGRYASSLAGHT